MRRITNAIGLVLLLAAALLTSIVVRAQATAHTADWDDGPSLAAHPGELSDVRGVGSLPNWDHSWPLLLNPEAVPAPNDTCHEPITVTLTVESSQYAAQFGTTEATTDADDPAQSCTIGGPAANSRSLWWSIGAPEDGQLTLSTITENPQRYDTVVSLYQGSATCGSLSPAEEIACDDDTFAFQSRLTALVDADQSYLAEVTGWGAENPAGELDIVVFFETDTRWQAPPGAVLPKYLHRHMAVTDGTYLYLIGGQDPYLSSSVYRYEPKIATWLQLVDIPSPYSNSDGAYLEGRIYTPSGYAGGGSYQPYEGVHYTYIISDDIWTVSAPMTSTGVLSEPVAWGAIAADPDHGLYYHTGGRYGTAPGQPLDYVLEYQAGTDSWRTLPSMATPRYAHRAVFLAGELCVAGGLDQEAQPMTSAECFDPESGTWSLIADMHVPRSMFGSAVGQDGRWYVFGGLTVNTITQTLTTPKTEVYDPETETWILYDQHWSLNQSRDWLTGTALEDEIFAAGGFLPDEALVVDSFEGLLVRDEGSFFSYFPLVKKGLPSHIGTLHEPNNAIPFAYGPLASGTELQSDFGYAWDTEDFFFLVATEATDIQVQLSDIPDGSDYDLYLYGTDATGTPKSLFAASENGSNLDESFTVNGAPAGVYYIRVRNAWRIPSSQRYLLQIVY
jgi:N-acetylneuraminic acid mutarotase